MQTGTPCRPRLRTIPSPWKQPPTTKAPVRCVPGNADCAEEPRCVLGLTTPLPESTGVPFLLQVFLMGYEITYARARCCEILRATPFVPDTKRQVRPKVYTASRSTTDRCATDDSNR